MKNARKIKGKIEFFLLTKKGEGGIITGLKMRMVLNFEGVGEEEYQQFFTTSSTVGRGTTRRAVRLNAISLSSHKDMAKVTEPKGLMPFGNPQCEKAAALRFAHLFAKTKNFSFCVGVLNKNANTEDGRNERKQML